MKELLDVLKYDENSPSGLTWNITIKPRIKAGHSAGTIDSDGYWVVRYKQKGYKAHRIVLMLHKADIEGLIVDHIDGNRQNNLVSNLRLIRKKFNSRNMAKSNRNTSGVTGVSQCKIKHHVYWCAVWYSDRTHYKRFNIAKYGEKEAKQLAIEYRLNKIQELNNNGYDYSERHGK